MLTKVKNDKSHGTVVTDESDNYRCCGIKYKNWVLTSGLILNSYISHEDLNYSRHSQKFKSNFELSESNGDPLTLSDIDIKYLTKKIAGKSFKICSESDELLLNDKNTSSNNCMYDNKRILSLNSCTAHSVGIFRSNVINKYISDNFSDWQLYISQDQCEHASDVIQSLLSMFLLLEIGDSNENNNYETPLRNFLQLCHGHNVFRGFDIIVESTPFTISQFYNSWSKGIISNIVGEMDSLFYTDARLVIGCVGAPVYRCAQHCKGDLVGMIINPMLWSQGEWAGYSIAVNLHVVLSEILSYSPPSYNNYKIFSQDSHIKNLTDKLDKSIVLIRCGSNWGSGVIVNAKLGIIITCAHVVNYSEEKSVRIECGSLKKKANVVWSNGPGEVFDLAVLVTEPLLKLKEVPFAKDPPVKGETVLCVGHAMVDIGRVTFSKGVIANVVPDILVQTTCCVQSGVSGGAVIRPCGSLIGIPVSNMSCANSGALFPHCNLSVPCTLFADVLSNYFVTKDVNCLKKLSSGNPRALQEWSFQNKSKL